MDKSATIAERQEAVMMQVADRAAEARRSPASFVSFVLKPERLLEDDD